MISLDGHYEGPRHDISWHKVYDDFKAYPIDLALKIDTLIFGRLTYELMASYWPRADAMADDPVVTERINNLPKIVISHTLEKADWQHTEIISDKVAETLSRLKSEPGKSIAIFGSSQLSRTLIPSGLIDEYRIVISPVVLGQGSRLFAGLKNALNLQLQDTRSFKSGNVMFTYQAIQP